MRAYNNVERVFMILVLLGGTLLYSAVVGHMAVLVATLNTTLNRHTQRQYLLGDMLRYIQAPSHFQTRVSWHGAGRGSTHAHGRPRCKWACGHVGAVAGTCAAQEVSEQGLCSWAGHGAAWLCETVLDE